jgi:hypothetical protein
MSTEFIQIYEECMRAMLATILTFMRSTAT